MRFRRRTITFALLVFLSACAAGGRGASIADTGAASVQAPTPLPDRPWQDEILYFVLVDRFVDGDPRNDRNVDDRAPGAFHGGDLAGLAARLDEIASLGVTAIWVNPLVKNIDGYVTGAGFPDWAYHGYWADDLHALDPRFGSEAEAKAFVAAAHARGIRVLLDVVYNHCGYDSQYVTDPRTRHWLRSPAHGGCGEDDETMCVAGLPDWKTEEPQVRDFLLDAQLAWGKRLGVDGFRLDTLKHVSHDFWQVHRRRSRAELGKGFFLLGELWGGDRESLDAYFAPDELDAGFDFGFQGSAVGWLLGRGRTVAFERYLESRQKVRAGHLLAHFLSSHDVPGALHLLAGDRQRFRLAAVLQLTTSGIPVVYYGEEVARPSGPWPDNRSDMPWGDTGVLPGAGKPRDEQLRAFYQQLIAIRRAHPALSRGAHQALSTDGDLLVFQRSEPGGDAVVVAVNRGAAPATVRVAAPDAWRGRSVADLLGHDAAPVDGGFLEISVPAYAARVLGATGGTAAEGR